jgi:DNA modification methylase
MHAPTVPEHDAATCVTSVQPSEIGDLPDLDFAGHDTLYATHGLHAYAAKCPPQLARFAISRYSQPGQLVLDPMAGSGTTLVEARLLGRSAIGYDLDPLACLIARVKSSDLDAQNIDSHAQAIIAQVDRDLKELRSERVSAEVLERSALPRFPRRDYWFCPSVSEALALLSFHIGHTTMPEKVRDFFWVVFSSIILSKVSVANARDIIHSRHHRFEHPAPPDVLARFQTRIKIMLKQVATLRELCAQAPATTAEIHQGDARHLTLPDGCVDLIATSPPYATALDYPRAHFLAVAWMEPVFRLSMEQYMALAPTYIGSERGHVDREFRIDARLMPFPAAQSALESLRQRDLRQAHLIQRYFIDMYAAFEEMGRVLRPSGHVFIVVCPSHVRQVQIPTHTVFTEMAQALGLRCIGEYQRTIDGNRRILPYMREAFGDRMNTEYVLVYQKG